ncbi:EAL domain-containing protein [Vibrio rarus]|uniref:EAL domain-containing protein n=1 Tax=Vibrio rarus TaxID=413403 RepID=UPI0021C30B7F|nr:EAL domain-containing protein [Vibrio rarus]
MSNGNDGPELGLHNGRPTIAVLVGSMASHYQEGIMRGVAYVAEQNNCNVIGFCGGVINSSSGTALARDKVFDLIDKDLISGVISPFSSHMRFLTKDQRGQFIEQFNSVPVVNIGSHIDSHTNITADYETGFTQLFEHFYQKHGYRKILLLRGPEHHASSEQRMHIYKKLLEKYQLPFDEKLVIYSDLKKSYAKKAIQAFFAENTHSVDAIITISDNQAFGVIEACQEAGIRVPEDIAVVGSLDTLEGAFLQPSLTSIREPLFELGHAAAIELLAQIKGETPRSKVKIPTSLIVRESCGCRIIEQDSDERFLSQSYEPLFDEIKAHVTKTIEQHRGIVNKSKVQMVIEQYQYALEHNDYAQLLIMVQRCLEDALESEEILIWLDVVSQFQISALQYLNVSSQPKKLTTFIAELTLLKNKMELTAIKFQGYETEYYLNYFRVIVNNLNASFDLSTIKKYAVDILKLSELYISIFHDVNADRLTATNIVSVRDKKFTPTDKHAFVANKLIPNNVAPHQQRYSLMVFPLSFANKPIGFMVTDLSKRKGTAFENLRAIISSALKNEMLIQDLKKAEERFSDIAHSTSNWLWETDTEHCFTYSSSSSSDIIGYEPDYLLGRPINELNINDGDSYQKAMQRHQDLVDYECWFQHQDGRIMCLLVSAKPIRKNGMFSGYRGVFEDITEQRLQEDKIKHLAYSDVLTGLPNRTLFQDKLDEAIRFSTQDNKSFAVMFIDLDHFKYINDSMGHAAGDQLLIKLSKRLKRCLRARDILARLGGDEFVIILPDIHNEQDVIDVTQRIFDSLKDEFIINSKSIFATLSLGISMFPIDGDNAETLLMHGDSAMYQAKSQGRNGYAFYNKLLEKKNKLRNTHEVILREAITTHSFILHYQPQVSVDTGNIIGFEVLVRIKNDEFGIIAPNNFIPLAEELGLVNQIDEWVFENACAQYHSWQEKGLQDVRLSINLSSMQLRNKQVLSKYIEIMESHNINPSYIQFEITENALIEYEDVALEILQGFKEYGVSIALGDFGSGYSSLSCINTYPIDTVKIDRAFISGAINNKKNQAIIKGTKMIADQLNLNIVAEGVETQSQFNTISQLGCHEIQGYYFYKPVTSLVAMELLTQQNADTRLISVANHECVEA